MADLHSPLGPPPGPLGEMTARLRGETSAEQRAKALEHLRFRVASWRRQAEDLRERAGDRTSYVDDLRRKRADVLDECAKQVDDIFEGEL